MRQAQTELLFAPGQWQLLDPPAQRQRTRHPAFNGDADVAGLFGPVGRPHQWRGERTHPMRFATAERAVAARYRLLRWLPACGTAA